jgi:hypothetical protein
MLARSWTIGAARIGAGVLATAAATAIIVAPTAQSETPAEPTAMISAPRGSDAGLAESFSGPLAGPFSASLAGPPGDALPQSPPTVDEVERASAADRATRAARSRQAIAARQAAFRSFTLKSEQTTDMRGVEPTLYRGRYFHPKAEERRLCIVRRESEGFYDVINPGGNYFGAYQVSRDLAEGVTYMMAHEHKELMGEARAKDLLADLRRTPMNKWPRYWQDAAFHTIMNWEYPLSGAAHWAGGRWHC